MTKKNGFGLILLLLVTFSCKKDKSKNIIEANKLYTITYNITGFTQSTGNIENKGTSKLTTASTTPISDNIDVLYCNIYDNDGNSFRITKQVKTQADFGQISNQLPAGTYTVIFAGGKSGLLSSGGSLSSEFFYYLYSIITEFPAGVHLDSRFQDTFFKKMVVTVGDNTSQNIALDRVVGRVEINITDKLPTNVKYILLKFDNEYFGFSVNNSSPIPGTPNENGASLYFAIPAASRGTSNYKLSFPVINTITSFNINLFATDSISGRYIAVNPTAFRTIPNVTVQQNKTTIISGNLFGGNGSSGSGGFNIIIDPAWDPVPITKDF